MELSKLHFILLLLLIGVSVSVDLSSIVNRKVNRDIDLSQVNIYSETVIDFENQDQDGLSLNEYLYAFNTTRDDSLLNIDAFVYGADPVALQMKALSDKESF